MKLATLRNGSRDGQLVIVSRDLSQAVAAPQIAPTLQAALDDWSRVSPKLAVVAASLEKGMASGSFAFDPERAMAPLPRAYHWVDGSAYVNHVELVRKARGAQMPASFWTDPLVYQGGSDDLLGARDDVPAVDEAHGIDFEAEVAVITDDVPIGTRAADAGEHIKLLMLV
ncbi:MAG: fumarylacetoacetate hydrolase family protein, partial [Steroidobacteraceae bacterium]